MINGITKIVMTKADVLDNFETLQICTAYQLEDNIIKQMPFRLDDVNYQPVLEKFEGWNCETQSIKKYEALPDKMKTYINFINQYLGVNVRYISNGPEREQLVEI